MRPWILIALAAVAGCAGVPEPASGVVTGRIVTRSHRVAPEEFSFQGRTYRDRALRIDPTGGLADAAVYVVGPEVGPWVSGQVSMVFGDNQFEPRVAFVSPGRPVEIGDARDDESHELLVELKGLGKGGDDRVHTEPKRVSRDGRPEQVCFRCVGSRWTREGKQHVRGRTVEITFDQPVLVPLDWD